MTTKNTALVELNISIDFSTENGDNIEQAARKEADNFIVIDKRTGNPVNAHLELNNSWINV
jgi:hypothetical protein